MLRRSVCCAPSRPRSVAYGTDNGSPREFDPIGHILASTSSWGGSHTNFFGESHRSYIEEGKAVVVWIAGQITIYFFYWTRFQDGSQKSLWRCLSHRAGGHRSPPPVAEPLFFFFFFFVILWIGWLNVSHRDGGHSPNAHAPPPMWYHCGFNYESGNTCLTLRVQVARTIRIRHRHQRHRASQ